MCRRPWVAAPAAVTPFSVGKYPMSFGTGRPDASYALLRREVPPLGRDPRADRWWETESTRPRSASLSSRSRSVDAGRRPKRASSSTVARGAAHKQKQRVLQCPAQGTQGRVRPHALQVDDDLQRGRFDVPHPAAHLVQDGGGHGAPVVAPFQVEPQGVAGHAQGLGGLLLTVCRWWART